MFVKANLSQGCRIFVKRTSRQRKLEKNNQKKVVDIFLIEYNYRG